MNEQKSNEPSEPGGEDDVQGHDASDEVEETPDADTEDNPGDEDTEGHLRYSSDATIKHRIRPLS